MSRILTSWSRVSLAVAAIAAGISTVALANDPSAIPLTPGKGLSLDVGNKHTMTYYEQKEGACGLTIVIASLEGGIKGDDSPGTRVTATVMPGTALRLDTPSSKSVEYFCGPDGRKMNAKVFEREGYSKDKKP